MIKKEDFLKRFPLKNHFCMVDDVVNEQCVIDEGKEYDCRYSTGKDAVTKKEDCKHWEEVPNVEFINVVWDWIDNYQKEKK